MNVESYVRSLSISGKTLDLTAHGKGPMMGGRAGAGAPEMPPAITPDLKAAVNAGSVLSFVDGLTECEREDVLFSHQLADRAATHDFDPVSQAEPWYGRYVDVLKALGWVTEQRAFTTYEQGEGEFRMDKAALALISAIATGGQLAVLNAAITALEKLEEQDRAIRLFQFHTSTPAGGHFQLGAVQKGEQGALAMAFGSFYFHSRDALRKFLFFSWGHNEVKFWTAAQKMTLNTAMYALARDEVKRKLQATFPTFIGELQIEAPAIVG